MQAACLLSFYQREVGSSFTFWWHQFGDVLKNFGICLIFENNSGASWDKCTILIPFGGGVCCKYMAYLNIKLTSKFCFSDFTSSIDTDLFRVFSFVQLFLGASAV